MDINITREDAGTKLVTWARAQFENGIERDLVGFCVILAIGDLLTDRHAELPNLGALTCS